MKMDKHDWENACEDIRCGGNVSLWANDIPKAYNNLGQATFERIAKSKGVFEKVMMYVPKYRKEIEERQAKAWEDSMARDRANNYREYGIY